MHITSHQFLDLNRMLTPITKRSKLVVRPDTINEIVRLAFKYAENEKPGAAHIDLPTNIAAMPVTGIASTTPLKPSVPNKEFASVDRIEAASKLINNAKKPVILAGHSAVRNHASKELTLLAEHLKIPVINTMMAKGIIPCDSQYAMWTVGIPQKDYTNKVLEDSDLIIAVGYDIVEFAPGKWNSDDNHTIIHLDLRPAHINKLYQPAVEVIGDISDSLMQLTRLCSRNEEPVEALKIKAAMLKEFTEMGTDSSWPPKPQRILADVRKVMGKDDIVISDVGAHKMWIARHYNCYRPNTCIISNGFASMGIAVPGAICAKLINPNKKVLAITGDGGFMMNCQEFETAMRIGTPFVTLIFHDNSYGLIKWKQDDRFGSHCFVDFDNPDFVKFAESFSAKGYRIEKTEELLPTLREAFKQTVPVIIDCPVNYSENSWLTKHLKELCNKL